MSETVSNPQRASRTSPAFPGYPAPHAHPERRDELHAMVKWTLDREDDAANTIKELSHRIDENSELAKQARRYASQLHTYVERLKAMLPPDDKAHANSAVLGGVCERVIGTLDGDNAKLFLIKFLLQHAETTSAILQSAGDRLNSQDFEALWRRADDERRAIFAWIKAHEARQMEIRARAAAASAAARSAPDATRVRTPPPTRAATAAEPAFNAERSVATLGGGPRISYRPPQTVKWM